MERTVSKLTMADIGEMFAMFGYPEDFIQKKIGATTTQEGAAEVYEHLKIDLHDHWNTVMVKLDPEQYEELSSVYDRLMSLKLGKIHLGKKNHTKSPRPPAFTLSACCEEHEDEFLIHLAHHVDTFND